MRDNSSPALSSFQQAATYYQQSRYVESIQQYLSGLEYDTSHYYIYADLAKAYEMVGKWEQALDCLDIALRLCPNSPTIIRRRSRINEEKEFYHSVINEINLVQEPPSDFVPNLRSGVLQRPQLEVGYLSYKLTVIPDINSKTVWHICQLIKKTFNEVGHLFDQYPVNQISISIINTYGATETSHPNWASGCYDGEIYLYYCAESEPELGVIYTLFRHEWTHLLIDLITHGNCPIWLNEGLAQTIARPPLSFETLSLTQAEKNGVLPTLSDLNQSFSILSPSERKIAYLQSAAIVAALIDEAGFSSICQLLNHLGNGTPIQAALHKTFDKSVIPN